MTELPPMDSHLLPDRVRSRFIDGLNGLRVHLLEAGHETQDRPLILLLHGFPEIAYSFRKIIVPLADAGFHVVAPDARGYGRTTGAATAYDTDISAFGPLNLVRDVLALLGALERREVALVAGHDYGSGVAAACALIRPDVFRSVAMMSAPFAGVPPPDRVAPLDLEAALASLDPPRKHYQWYYSTRQAEPDMLHAPQGLHAFLRAYFHHKSADWPGNDPHKLDAWSAAELAKLPTYYVMNKGETMPETVAAEKPSSEQIAACRWLPDAALAVYAAEYARTGFQGALNAYRCRTTGLLAHELSLFAGRTIDVPACFFAGTSDWGTYQKPGDVEAMQSTACTDMRICERIEGAGHWVQQERPDALVSRLLAFLRDAR